MTASLEYKLAPTKARPEQPTSVLCSLGPDISYYFPQFTFLTRGPKRYLHSPDLKLN